MARHRVPNISVAARVRARLTRGKRSVPNIELVLARHCDAMPRLPKLCDPDPDAAEKPAGKLASRGRPGAVRAGAASFANCCLSAGRNGPSAAFGSGLSRRETRSSKHRRIDLTRLLARA